MSQSKYIIGIDLGTTNSTVAYCLKEEERPVIHQFPIPQVLSAGTQGETFSLPSYVYFPISEELTAKSAGVEWDPSRGYCIGVYGRDRGAEIPSRMISSAKSWLCHSGIDRREDILPLEADEDAEKMSPLKACSSMLQHIKEAWDFKHADDPFIEQTILVTVPASFDPSARQLVQEAAELAQYCEVILLEEPLAAFYAWLYAHEEKWRTELKVGDVILVVDIGGGTTDFSLISVEDREGNLTLNRMAVGSHLLLGGDNIDLSLAYLAQKKLEEDGHTIDDWQFRALTHTCRQAKEKLLSIDAPKQAEITVLGRGSRLIGGTLKTKIAQTDAKKMIVDGFFPIVDPEEQSSLEKRVGLQQIGLPYANDARMTSQLAKFLSMTGEVECKSMDKFVMPTAVLFNGGTLKASALRERLVEQLNKWAKFLGKEAVIELPNPDYDYAVSRGAVYYGLARQGKAIRVKSGSSRSYYIGVEDSAPAVPGFAAPIKAVCVVPFGMEEGTEQQLENQEFALVVGEPVSFRFFSHATPSLMGGIGTIVKQWKQELTELHPLETKLEKGESDGKSIHVKLKAHVTELGILELWCVAGDGRKWKLEFDIRERKEVVCGL